MQGTIIDDAIHKLHMMSHVTGLDTVKAEANRIGASLDPTPVALTSLSCIARTLALDKI